MRFRGSLNLHLCDHNEVDVDVCWRSSKERGLVLNCYLLPFCYFARSLRSIRHLLRGPKLENDGFAQNVLVVGCMAWGLHEELPIFSYHNEIICYYYLFKSKLCSSQITPQPLGIRCWMTTIVESNRFPRQILRRSAFK